MNPTDKELVERELVAAKADLVYLAKLIKRLRGKFINIADHVEDEGDRTYFGSTNHADEFKEGVQSLDDANWSLILDRAKGRDLYAEMRKLRAEAKALSTENASLREKLAEAENAHGYLCPACSSQAVPHIVSGMGLRATCACGFSGGEHEFTRQEGI